MRVPLQVRAAEEQRVARVDDLHDELRALEHAPQLPPHLQVLLEGREERALLLLDLGHLRPPRHEGGALVPVELDRRLLRLPGRPARDRDVDRRLGLALGVQHGVDLLAEDDHLASLGREVGAGQDGTAHQLLQVVALRDRAQLVLAALRLEQLRILSAQGACGGELLPDDGPPQVRACVLLWLALLPHGGGDVPKLMWTGQGGIIWKDLQQHASPCLTSHTRVCHKALSRGRDTTRVR